MNYADATTEELVQFIADESRRADVEVNAVPKREFFCAPYLTQAVFLVRDGVPILILWARDHWCHTLFTGKRLAAAMLEIMGEYTEHMLGLEAKPRIIVGRVNRRRAKA